MSAKWPVWITEVPNAAPAGETSFPLYGMTFAIKDTIDLAAVPTTAGTRSPSDACPSVFAGTIEKLNCEKGALVSAGQQIATLRLEVSE